MKRYSTILMMVGGSLTSISCFLPWAKYDRTLTPRLVENPGPDVIFVSGFNIGGIFVLIVLLSALVILGVSIFMLHKNTLWKSRTPILISIGIGLFCVMLTLFLFTQALNSSKQKMLSTLESTGLEKSFENAIRLQFGGFSAAIGFIVALFGVWKIPKSDVSIDNNG